MQHFQGKTSHLLFQLKQLIDKVTFLYIYLYTKFFLQLGHGFLLFFFISFATSCLRTESYRLAFHKMQSGIRIIWGTFKIQNFESNTDNKFRCTDHILRFITKYHYFFPLEVYFQYIATISLGYFIKKKKKWPPNETVIWATQSLIKWVNLCS